MLTASVSHASHPFVRSSETPTPTPNVWVPPFVLRPGGPPVCGDADEPEPVGVCARQWRRDGERLKGLRQQPIAAGVAHPHPLHLHQGQSGGVGGCVWGGQKAEDKRGPFSHLSLQDAAVVSLAQLLGDTLRELDLTSCANLTDLAVCSIAAHLQKLVLLRLARCKEITDWGLLGMAEAAQSNSEQEMVRPFLWGE